MLTENYALKFARAAIASGLILLGSMANAQSSAASSVADNGVPAVDANLVKKTAPLKKTYYKYQWQLVTISNHQGEFYNVCPKGVFKNVRCYYDGSMQSERFTFLEQDLSDLANAPIEILSVSETSSGDLDVLYKVHDSDYPVYIPPVIGEGTTLNRIAGANGSGKSAKEIRDSHRGGHYVADDNDRNVSLPLPGHNAAKEKSDAVAQAIEDHKDILPTDTTEGRKIYFKWQWQLARVEHGEQYYMVCPKGVFKNMFCYPDSSRLTHVDFTFLEEDLMRIAQHPVEVLSTQKTPAGDLKVTYKINNDIRYVRPPIADSTVIYRVEGQDGTGKNSIDATEAHNIAIGVKTNESDEENTEGSGFLLGIVLVFFIIAGIFTVFGDINVFALFDTRAPTSPSSYQTTGQSRQRQSPRETPIEVPAAITPEKEKMNIELATAEASSVKRKVYVD